MSIPLYANYDAWLAGLRNWLSTDNQPSADTGLFLYLAEQRLNRELQSVPMETNKDVIITAFTAGLPIDLSVEIPDFNKIRLVLPFPDGPPLYSASLNEISNLYATGASPGLVTLSAPGFFCIDANKLYLYPKPLEDQVVSVFYYPYIPPLSASVATNTFSNFHSDVLLYAALIAGSQFVIEDERVPVWKDAYAEGLESSNNTGKHQKLGSTPLVRQIKGLS